MMRKQSRLISVAVASLLTFTFSLSTLTAQVLNVKESIGTQTSYALNNIRKMSFSSGNLTITKNDNSTEVFHLIDLSNLNFQDFSSSIVAFEDRELQYLTTYPNPVTHQLNVDLSGTGSLGGTLSILNIEGRVMIIQQVEDSGIVSIDMSQLDKGFYICCYSTKTKVLTTKIIKR